MKFSQKNDHLPQDELPEDHFAMIRGKIVKIRGHTITLDYLFFIETSFPYAQSSSR